jgi:hypothetical protein
LVGLLLVPVVLSLLLLGAHFLRAGNLLVVLLVLVLVALVGVRRRWVARVLPAALVLGAVEWIRTTVQYVAERSSEGEPYVRLIVILGSVSLFTALSALAFVSAQLQGWYSREPE